MDAIVMRRGMRTGFHAPAPRIRQYRDEEREEA